MLLNFTWFSLGGYSCAEAIEVDLCLMYFPNKIYVNAVLKHASGTADNPFIFTQIPLTWPFNF
jgi:hypothetical protein